MNERTGPRAIIRASALIVAACLLFVAGTPTARAEGSFTSYMEQVQPAFNSRTWSDLNIDAASTVVVLSNSAASPRGNIVSMSSPSTATGTGTELLF